jgi:integrase
VFKRPEQRDHFKSVVTGLVYSENRTVAGIYQRLVFGPEYDSLHHFMSYSPGAVESLREQRLKFVKEELDRNAGACSSRKLSTPVHSGINPLIFVTLAYTGARPNELQALRFRDIDWVNKTISITKGRVRGVDGKPKTKSSIRTIPILSCRKQEKL